MKHRHRIKHTTTITWDHCVATGPCDGQAHGWATDKHTCDCGAIKYEEFNQSSAVGGKWQAGKRN